MAKGETVSKQPIKTEPTKSCASDALLAIMEAALNYRMEGTTPTLDVIARLEAQGSRLPRLDKDETVQNAAVLSLMKKHRLIAD